MKRRVGIKINKQIVYFISPEDLILSKLEWFKKSQSTRQLEDIESVLKITDKIDKKYLKNWAATLGVSKILDEMMNEIGL